MGWGQKKNFYTWALVDYSDGEGPQPVVVSRSFGSPFVDDLIDFVQEDENNQITDKMFKVTKSGAKKETRWKLREAKGVDLYDDTDVELPDLEQSVLRFIPYEDQPAYYGAVYKDGDPTGDDDDDDESQKPAPAASGGKKIVW